MPVNGFKLLNNLYFSNVYTVFHVLLPRNSAFFFFQLRMNLFVHFKQKRVNVTIIQESPLTILRGRALYGLRGVLFTLDVKIDAYSLLWIDAHSFKIRVR